ncbi:MAG: hypothetical protein QME40_07070 [bacterium]|nr:hypothetical protein [bacterium]
MLIERVYRTNIKIEEKKKRTTTQTLLNTFRHYCMTIVKQGTEVQAIPNEFSSLQQEICQTLGIIPWCRDP